MRGRAIFYELCFNSYNFIMRLCFLFLLLLLLLHFTQIYSGWYLSLEVWSEIVLFSKKCSHSYPHYIMPVKSVKFILSSYVCEVLEREKNKKQVGPVCNFFCGHLALKIYLLSILNIPSYLCTVVSTTTKPIINLQFQFNFSYNGYRVSQNYETEILGPLELVDNNNWKSSSVILSEMLHFLRKIRSIQNGVLKNPLEIHSDKIFRNVVI